MSGGLSLWLVYWNAFWEVTACQWQKKLDPTYDTYGSGLENYDYSERVAVSDVEEAVAAFETTGKILLRDDNQSIDPRDYSGSARRAVRALT